MTDFYHVTSAENAAKIMAEGMLPGSYWGEDDIAEYYAETVEDDGDEPVMLKITLEDLLTLGEENICPDHEGIAEPLTHTLGMSEGEVIEAWEACDGTWKDSLKIIRSFKVTAAIPPALMIVEEPGYENEM